MDELPLCQAVCWQLTLSETKSSEVTDDNKEEDFPTAELNDPVWPEVTILKEQQLYTHQILHWLITGHTLRPVQEEVLPGVEPMDVSILDDLLDVINVPKADLSSDFDLALEHAWISMVKWHLNSVNTPMGKDHQVTLIDTIHTWE